MRTPDIARELLELILEVKIELVECINAQQVLNYSTDRKSVRLDVFLKDGQKITYDLEMETGKNPGRLKIFTIRSRLYGGAIDMEMYPIGADYNDVKPAYVIFLCLHDPFDRGLAKYSCSVTCTQDHTAGVQNGITYVYLNCDARIWNISEELHSLLSYIRDRTICETELAKQIDSVVRQYNEDHEWRRWFMTLEQKFNERFEDGRTEGREQESTETIAAMIENGFDDKMILSVYKTLTAEDIAKIRRRIGQSFQ
jgi:predicted transposase/invertase (TIGR01784 family)